MKKWGTLFLTLIFLSQANTYAVAADVEVGGHMITCCMEKDVGVIEGCGGGVECPERCEQVGSGSGVGYAPTCCERNSPRMCVDSTPKPVVDTCCTRLGGTMVTDVVPGKDESTWYCCKNGKNIEGGAMIPACCTQIGGELYNKELDANGDPIEECCPSSRKVTKLGSLDTCCPNNQEGYLTSDGSDGFVAVCCDGEVWLAPYIAANDGEYGKTSCCERGRTIVQGDGGAACCPNPTDTVYAPWGASTDTARGEYYRCCAGTPYTVEGDNKDCCETGKYVVSNGALSACCSNSTDKPYEVTKNITNHLTGGQVEVTTTECCAGEPYFVSDRQDCCEAETSVLLSLSYRKSICCPSGSAVYKTSNPDDVDTVEGACCPQGDEVYKIDSDGLEGCCSSSMKVTNLGEIDVCCPQNETGYLSQDSAGNDIGACCDGTTFTNTKHVQDCCKKAENLVAAGHSASAVHACCVDSSEKDKDGFIREGCCELAGGVFVVKPLDSGDSSPDGKLPEGDNGTCCQEGSSKDLAGDENEDCCTNAGGTWNDGTCCKGSMDLGENQRTKECCENANGVWQDTFCCATWGKKDGESCKASSLPDGDS